MNISSSFVIPDFAGVDSLQCVLVCLRSPVTSTSRCSASNRKVHPGTSRLHSVFETFSDEWHQSLVEFRILRISVSPFKTMRETHRFFQFWKHQKLRLVLSNRNEKPPICQVFSHGHDPLPHSDIRRAPRCIPSRCDMKRPAGNKT